MTDSELTLAALKAIGHRYGSQVELARIIGCAPASISKWLGGQQRYKMGNQSRILLRLVANGYVDLVKEATPC